MHRRAWVSASECNLPQWFFVFGRHFGWIGARSLVSVVRYPISCFIFVVFVTNWRCLFASPCGKPRVLLVVLACKYPAVVGAAMLAAAFLFVLDMA